MIAFAFCFFILFLVVLNHSQKSAIFSSLYSFSWSYECRFLLLQFYEGCNEQQLNKCMQCNVGEDQIEIAFFNSLKLWTGTVGENLGQPQV